MALTDTAIRNAKPSQKPVKLFDERGLYLGKAEWADYLDKLKAGADVISLRGQAA